MQNWGYLLKSTERGFHDLQNKNTLLKNWNELFILSKRLINTRLYKLSSITSPKSFTNQAWRIWYVNMQVIQIFLWFLLHLNHIAFWAYNSKCLEFFFKNCAFSLSLANNFKRLIWVNMPKYFSVCRYLVRKFCVAKKRWKELKQKGN